VLLKTALALASRGLHVFPCLPRDKRPATPHGCKDATTDVLVIREWWGTQPDFNIGIATGTVSDTWVLDVDGLDGESGLRHLEAQHGTLPPTVEVITGGGGRHLYFRMPAGRDVRNTASAIAPKIDTRGTGGFVIAPPSTHASGRRYHWSVDSGRAISPAPTWLLDLIAVPAKNGGTPPPIPPGGWRDLVGTIAEGRRDCTLAKVSGHLFRHYVDPHLALELVDALNTARCRPPLSDADVHRIVNSIAGRELRRRRPSDA
jgi:hypothetical protein